MFLNGFSTSSFTDCGFSGLTSGMNIFLNWSSSATSMKSTGACTYVGGSVTVSSGSSFTAIDCAFTGQTNTSILNYGTLNLQSCTFTPANAPASVPIISQNSGNSTIFNSQFTVPSVNFPALSVSNAGSWSSLFDLENSKVTGSGGNPYQGGLVYLSSSGKMNATIINTTFTTGRASFGGMIYAFLTGSGNAFTLASSTFTDASASSDGGAVYLSTSAPHSFLKIGRASCRERV